MSEANPYSAPDAALDTGFDAATYDPSFFSFRGRIGRMRYIAYMFACYLVAIVSILVATAISGAAAGITGGDFSSFPIPLMILLGVIYLAIIVFWAIFGKRRLNDLNRSGWWLLLFFAPGILSAIHPILSVLVILTLALTVYMVFFPGSEDPNNYGPPPSPNSVGVLVLAWLGIVFMLLGTVGMIAAVVIPQFAGMPQ
jgi:uncharacterized membrane protein YhaH (DUF805 family)